MAYIKGKIIQEIYSNPGNGYVVGLFRVSDGDLDEYKNKVITFTGIIDDIKYKTNYKLEGKMVHHNKYGSQFQVDGYEILLPSSSEELIEFFSSSLFPIGEKMAMRIVEKLGDDAISKIISDENALMDIPRLGVDKARVIRERVLNYQGTSEIVLELKRRGFDTKDAIYLMKKYQDKIIDIINENIYKLIEDDDMSFNDIDKIAMGQGYMINDERRLLALTINLMNLISFNRGDTYLYFDEIYNEIIKNTEELSSEEFQYILLKLKKLDKIVIKGDRYYLKELYDA